METHILIVEDELRLAEIIQKQLQESGFVADIASDGYVGKRMVENKEYDLVVLDINLPLMNGYEAAKTIREFNSKITIIAQTAFAFTSDKEKAIQSGCDVFITKPVNSDDIIKIIKNLKRYN